MVDPTWSDATIILRRPLPNGSPQNFCATGRNREQKSHSRIGRRNVVRSAIVTQPSTLRNMAHGPAVNDSASRPILKNNLQPMGKEMGKPFLNLEGQRSLFPLFPSDLVGLAEVPGEHPLHLNGELTAQNDRIHLVIT